MKKIFVCFAALAAMVFIVGCGGGSSNDENNDITCTVVADKTWTDKADSLMSWQDAQDYCNNLTACGYSDWHLPTISELRSLIQNCPATQTGGECGVTDSCLSSSDCGVVSACSGCDSDSSGKYSKLGDTTALLSSSVLSDGSDSAWYVSFYLGSVSGYSKSHTYSVRCVRNAN